MDTGTNKNNLDWLSPDVLIEFIDELRKAGYKIGIPQYIAAQDLILILIAQGEALDSPDSLRSLLGPIFCSSPIEQEEFQQRFDRWFESFYRCNISKEEIDVKAKALSDELETERILSYWMQYLIFFISIFIFLSILLFPSYTEKKAFIEPKSTLTEPLPAPTEPLPAPTEPLPAPTEPIPTPIELPSKVPQRKPLIFNWQILVLLATACCIIFLIWRLWWLWRAELFLQRHSTTQQPELQKISITGFEENLVPSIVLLQIARSLRYRISISSNELDIYKTINLTLRQGGWLTPVYRTYQVLPEYLFLVNRASYRDHQAKFVEEIIERLKNEGVFATIYFFDDDPRMCFPHEREKSPLILREIRSKYSQHCLVIISDIENFFSPITGEIEPWLNQLIIWEKRAILTPTTIKNWGDRTLELTQKFIILPATFEGLLVLNQRINQESATYFISEEPRISLPDTLRIQPYLWVERNPPPIEQFNIMLELLDKYLGKDGFYWLSACAIFPKLDWNITIYLGNVLKTESGASLIEACSLTDLSRLPWLRYAYMPDWLRIYLITILTEEQKQTIRGVFQDLLITSVQGSTSKLQLEIAKQYHSLISKLSNSILYLISKKAPIDSPFQDYIFLSFMRGKSTLSMQVSDEFIRSIQRQKRNFWSIQIDTILSIINFSKIMKAVTWTGYGVAGVSALFALVIGVEWLKFSVRPLPTATRAPVIVYARDGATPLREPKTISHVDMKRLEEFGPYLPAAIVASEDSGYYWHFGVDPLAILRDMLINNRSKDVQQKASTVTQQVARTLFGDYIGIQDSLGRKLREAIVSLKLETFYSKDEILLTYLNRVFLGGNTSGFEDAARYYFEKSARELTLSEAATLVGILPAPNAFDFCGDDPNKLEAVEYRNHVIKRMLESGKIKPEDANRATRSTVQISPKVCEQQAKTIAPHFYNYVLQELESILGEGAAKEGNYIIETQLDPAIQSQAESALRNYVNNAGSTFGFSQGAVVTLDSSTGSILAMVGGTDYRKSQLNRAVQAKRQPGTTFKIFTYTAAIQQGISASKSYSCAPLTWQGFAYKPCDAGADTSLDIATGLALSENPIALRVAREIGLDKVVSMAQRLGIKSSLDPVPGLVLGQSAVDVFEMTGAFGAIGNRGVWNPPHAISRILDSSDCRDRNDFKTCRVIYSFDQDPDANKRVISSEVADEMISLMRGVITKGTGRSAALGLGEAGETGTTDKNVDLWFIGFIPSRRLVTGVWLGNDNNSPTSGSSDQAAQLWGNYMGRITK